MPVHVTDQVCTWRSNQLHACPPQNLSPHVCGVAEGSS